MILRSDRVCPSAGAPDDHEAENLSLKCSFGWGLSVMSGSLVLDRLVDSSTHWRDHLVDSSCKTSRNVLNQPFGMCKFTIMLSTVGMCKFR